MRIQRAGAALEPRCARSRCAVRARGRAHLAAAAKGCLVAFARWSP